MAKLPWHASTKRKASRAAKVKDRRPDCVRLCDRLQRIEHAKRLAHHAAEARDAAP